MLCDACGGPGLIWVHLNSRDLERHGFQWIECQPCAGTGAMTPERRLARKEAREAGQKLRADRVARGATLGDEARRLGVSPAEVSRREMGDV